MSLISNGKSPARRRFSTWMVLNLFLCLTALFYPVEEVNAARRLDPESEMVLKGVSWFLGF